MAAGYQLKRVSPKDIEFSKQNPRGESPDEIRNDKAFEQLKDSVAQFGVLVPIVVHEAENSSPKRYVLVDGERRLRAAIATNVAKIPAHIASSKDRMGELIQAFHIHMLRKQWKPVATARALKRIQKELKKENTQTNEKELLEDLQVRTGCTDNQLQDLQRGIQYSENVLKDVDSNKIKWSHLVQFEASFVEQLDQHYPKLLRNLGKRQVRNALVKKARNKIISDTRSLIENVLPVIKRAKLTKEKKLAEKLLETFITKEDLSPEVIKLFYDKAFPPPKNQVELADSAIENSDLLNTILLQIDANLIISFHKKAKVLKKSLDILKRTLGKKLRQLNNVMS